MDTRLLRFYEAELTYLREMGAEFAASYPKVASRLGITGLEVLDPYVERLLEGSAFLAARVQLELDMQFPAFTQHLLEIVYPHYLAPTPSVMIVQMLADPAQGGLDTGFRLERGTAIRAPLREGETTACLFQTSQDTVLWDVEVAELDYIDGRGELVAAGLGAIAGARAGLRIRLRRSGGKPINEMPLDTLGLYVGNQAGPNWTLLEALSTRVAGLAGRSTDRRDDWIELLPDAAILPRGFTADESLLPTPVQSFDGYRLLQEYFAMPERYFFVDLDGILPAVQRAEGSDVDVYVLLHEGAPQLKTLDAESITLGAVPAINLFERRLDRIAITPKDTEHHVVADRTAPLDFEVHTIRSVAGISAEGRDDTVFRPFYSSTDFTAAGEVHPAYYQIRRRMRARSEAQRLKGTRTNYLGSETFLSLVDRNEAPYPDKLEQLAVTALCTNRDLPLLLSTGTDDDFYLPDGGPIRGIRTLVTPTRPRPTLAQGATAWRLISHLSLNYLSIADTDRGGGAEALRELIGLYTPLGDRALEQQVEGIVGIESRPIVRRLAGEVLSTPVRGLEIKLTFDDSFFEGTSPYALGAVLRHFFAKYVGLNSFTETVIESDGKGEITRWPAMSGQRPLI